MASLNCFHFTHIFLAHLTFIYCVPADLEIIMEHIPDICEDYTRFGDTVHVDYTGMFQDGRVFDSSIVDGRGPVKFQLGSGNIIKGWERGLQGMCIGEKRKLIIPSHLAYGSQGVDGVIPPDATLLFQVQLHSIDRDSFVDELNHFMGFAMWPIGLLTLGFYCYQKINAAIAKERKSEKRSNKKKR